MKIDESVIEELMYDYKEGNLSKAEMQEVDLYLQTHQEYKQMFDLYNANLKVPLEEVNLASNTSNTIIKRRKRRTLVVSILSAAAILLSVLIVNMPDKVQTITSNKTTAPVIVQNTKTQTNITNTDTNTTQIKNNNINAYNKNTIATEEEIKEPNTQRTKIYEQKLFADANNSLYNDYKTNNQEYIAQFDANFINAEKDNTINNKDTDRNNRSNNSINYTAAFISSTIENSKKITSSMQDFIEKVPKNNYGEPSLLKLIGNIVENASDMFFAKADNQKSKSEN